MKEKIRIAFIVALGFLFLFFVTIWRVLINLLEPDEYYYKTRIPPEL